MGEQNNLGLIWNWDGDMKATIKLNLWWVSLTAVLSVLALPAHAASFDCAKASTKVEHIICDNPDISKLDEELATSYKAALQNQANAESIKQGQRKWLKGRNDCADAICVKRAYETRLLSFASPELSHGVIAGIGIKAKEANKKELVKQIMEKLKFTQFAGAFCEGFLNDFRRMKNIEFVEPIDRSEKFDAPIWKPYRRSCPNIESFDRYDCDARVAMSLEGLSQNEQEKQKKMLCEQYRCTENFKHFRLKLKGDEGNRTEDIFYCERAHGPLNMQGIAQSYMPGGYTVTDLKHCQILRGVLTQDHYSYEFHHPLNNVNGLIMYKGKHYIFELREIDKAVRAPEKASYELELWGYDRRGGEKRSRFYSSCLFTTAASPEQR